jgi:paspaline synthase
MTGNLSCCSKYIPAGCLPIPTQIMESLDFSNAPSEFQEWKNTYWFCTVYTNFAWTIVYLGMIQRSVQDHSYGMPLFSQCLNLAWEITFGFIYPSNNWVLTSAFRLAVIINSAVTYTAIRYGSREWEHAPIVRRNLPIIYAVGIGTSVACFLGLAKQIGEAKACVMTGVILQATLSVGSLRQLLTRGSTRGFSFSLWFVLPSFTLLHTKS